MKQKELTKAFKYDDFKFEKTWGYVLKNSFKIFLPLQLYLFSL